MQGSFLLLSTLLLGACTTTAPDAVAPEAIAPQTRAAPLPASVPATPAAPKPAGNREVDALRDWVARQDRLYRVGAPLLIQNTPLCKRNARPLAGFSAKTHYSYGANFSAAAREAFSLDERLRVMNVMPGSGAERSGLSVGDILVSVQGKNLSSGPNAEREAGQLVAAAMQSRSTLHLGVLRHGNQMTLDIPLTRACAIGIELGDSQLVNSYADTERVMITRGMLDYVQSDEELAYVLAKEMAHVTLNQGPRPLMAAAITSLTRFAPLTATASMPAPAAFKPFSPVLDSTADKISLYMLVRAGYSIDNAQAFWKRLAARYPATEAGSHTELHPATPYRLSVIGAVVPAIKAKQKNRMALMP